MTLRACWQHFLSMIGIKTTWQWCAVGDAFSHPPHFSAQLEECHNDIPVIAGGFLWVFPFGDNQEACEAFCREMNEDECEGELNA